MDHILQAMLDRTGRWPTKWNIPSEQEIREVLQGITLLIRNVTEEDRRLFAIDQSKLDIFNTDITNLADTSWGPDEVKGLRVISAFCGRIPIGNYHVSDPHVTVEDVIANIGELKPGTLVETWTGSIGVDFDELGEIWRPIFITYVQEEH